MDEFKGNTFKAKEERQQRQPVVSGTVRTVKKTGVRGITEAVKNNVRNSNVADRIVHEIIFPAVLDGVNTGLAGILGIDPARLKNVSNSVISTAKSSSYWNAGNRVVEAPGRTIRTDIFKYEDLVYSTRGDAEAVLRDMDACVEQYRSVSVADLLQSSGELPSSADFRYGWTDLKEAAVVQTSDGYMLRMPRPKPLD